jgi:AraC-like DNA-binding protein
MRNEKPSPLLHAGRESTFWAGSADYLAGHQGGAPVFLAGLYGKFRLRLLGQPWMACRAALIPPGLWHELDFAGEPFAALYIEPKHGGLNAMSPLLRVSSNVQNVSMGSSDMIPLLRTFYEDSFSEQWVGEALSDLLAFARRTAETESIEPRLARVADLLHESCDDPRPVSEFARAAGLSPSRFQHLFTQQFGVPFRRYRAWSRLRMAWLQIAKGATITEAAHMAGFFDSAHFAHEYRRTFGRAASNGLRRMVRTSNHA